MLRTYRAEYERLLPLVEKPGRYLGNERGAVRKDLERTPLRFALAFPEVYEIAQSHLGLQILYEILNRRPDVAAERVYAPWPDLEALLRAHGLPLVSLESGLALADFHVIGFSLQYELTYTNLLTMLELGRVPLRAAARGPGDPLVIAGGPCAFNPEPLAPFLDGVLLGDGEEAIGEIVDVVRAWDGRDRRALLAALAAVPGFYVPAFFAPRYRADGTLAEIVPLDPARPRVAKRVLVDSDTSRPPADPIAPTIDVGHGVDVGAVRIGGRAERVQVDEDPLGDPRARGVERHDLRERPVGAIARGEERRHVEAGDRGERGEERPAVPPIPGAHDVDDFADGLLAVAEQHAVEKRRQRLGVERARPPRDHQRVARPPRRRAQRHPPELEHGEQVRVGELVLEAEADHVEVREREPALERDERQSPRAQERLEVGPGRVDALGGHVRAAIQDLVEDLEAEVGLGDLVDLRERERKPQRRALEVLADGTPLVAEVAPGLLDQRQEALVLRPVGAQHAGGGSIGRRVRARNRACSPLGCPLSCVQCSAW